MLYFLPDNNSRITRISTKDLIVIERNGLFYIGMTDKQGWSLPSVESENRHLVELILDDFQMRDTIGNWHDYFGYSETWCDLPESMSDCEPLSYSIVASVTDERMSLEEIREKLSHTYYSFQNERFLYQSFAEDPFSEGAADYFADDLDKNMGNTEDNQLNIIASEIAKDLESHSEYYESALVLLMRHTGSLLLSWSLLTRHCTIGYFASTIASMTELRANRSFKGHKTTRRKKSIEFHSRLASDVLKIMKISEQPIDLVSKLIENDESVVLEFKSSLRTPYPDYPEPAVNKRGQKVYRLGKNEFTSKKEIQRFMEGICLKTIVAFLNTQGGTLLIGVADDKELIGIEREGFENSDAFLLHITQIINNRIGKQYDIVSEIRIFEKKQICLVRVAPFFPKPGQSPAHLDKEALYRRTGPRSDPLTGEEAAKFISERVSRSTSQ